MTWSFSWFTRSTSWCGLQRGRGWAFVLSGLSAALTCSYHSGRITPLIVVCVGVYLLVARRALLRARWQGGLLWMFAVLVGMGPTLIVFLRYLEGFMSRSCVFFLFTPRLVSEHLRNKYQVDSLGAILWEQAERTLLVFHDRTSTPVRSLGC